MNALIDFVNAAASHFGLPSDQLTHGSGISTENGDFELVIRLKLTPENVIGIGKRMAVLATEARVDAELARQQAPQPPSDADLRLVYNAMSEGERSHWGSFNRFKQGMGMGDAYTANLHAVTEAVMSGLIDGPAPVEVPPVVWLDSNEATDQQKAMAVGYDVTTDRYGVDPGDLTAEQLAKRGDHANG